MDKKLHMIEERIRYVSSDIGDFITDNKEAIDCIIRSKFEGESFTIEDNEREYWIFRDDDLAKLARKGGVNI